MVKKIIPLFLALATILCIQPMRGDEPPKLQTEIPIKKVDQAGSIRSLCKIQACYYGMLSAVYTTVSTDLGEIDVTVTNCSTGEFWQDTIDSSITSQHLLQISGTSGFYELAYTTEDGGFYEGSFVIY